MTDTKGTGLGLLGHSCTCSGKMSLFFFFKELGQLEGVKVRGKGVRYLEEQVIITRQEWRKGRSLEFKVG